MSHHDSNRAHHDPNKEQHHGKVDSHVICQYCQAVYQKKHWAPMKDMDPTFIDQMKKGCCPACHLEKNHLSDGVLHLSGTFLKNHQDEIMHLVMNTAEKEEERDVLNRVERFEHTQPDTITIYTTKNSLAVELGKKIDSAYKGGTLEIKFSEGERVAEVSWHLDK